MEVYRQLSQRNFHPLGTCAFVAHFRIGASWVTHVDERRDGNRYDQGEEK
jgi:hypothetical protein